MSYIKIKIWNYVFSCKTSSSFANTYTHQKTKCQKTTAVKGKSSYSKLDIIGHSDGYKNNPAWMVTWRTSSISHYNKKANIMNYRYIKHLLYTYFRVVLCLEIVNATICKKNSKFRVSSSDWRISRSGIENDLHYLPKKYKKYHFLRKLRNNNVISSWNKYNYTILFLLKINLYGNYYNYFSLKEKWCFS